MVGTCPLIFLCLQCRKKVINLQGSSIIPTRIAALSERVNQVKSHTFFRRVKSKPEMNLIQIRHKD